MNELVAISSIRPMGESAEIDANQIRAIQSWARVFSHIYLFGPHDERLDWTNVTFVDAPNFPTLSLLMFAAVMTEKPAAILNADIVVAPQLQQMLQYIWSRAFVFTSQRYEFDPVTEDYDNAKIKDLGCDFFCAQPMVWKRAWREIPTTYRIGNGQWDNWTLGFMGTIYRRRFVDVSKLRLIYHPAHVERKRVTLQEAPRDKYIESGLGFPYKL